MSTVLFKRGSSSDMADTPITDGMLFFNEEDFKIYMDNGSERIQYGGDTPLIADPSAALLTNAFSARASLDLFLQKTSVIDSKSTALAVTQNYIPLGCLAFKEVVGTNNYASIGDGTISGGLTNLNSRVTTAQNGVTNLQAQLQASGTNFYFDYKNGQYGWNSSSARGAGTFHPFKTTSQIGTGASSYNVKNVRSDWNSLTVNDFVVAIVANKSVAPWWQNWGEGVLKGNLSGMSITITKSYSNGVFYVNGVIAYTGYATSDSGSARHDFDTSLDITSVLGVYCIK